METDLIIREYSNDDIVNILELLNKNLKGQQHLNIKRDVNWWNWKYENNIFGKPIITVAEYKGKIIACRPFWPWRLNIRGKIINCYQPVDSVVDKDFRGKGLFTKLTSNSLLEVSKKTDLIFNFPNEQSLGAYLNLGWSYVGKLEWYVKIKKVMRSCKQLMNQTGYDSIKLQENDKISEQKINQIREIYEFNGVFKTNITKEFLKWRYLQHPQLNYGMNLIIESKNKQFTYVFIINENDYGRELVVLDYFGSKDLFINMLAELDVLSLRYNTSFISIIKKKNVFEKELMKRFYIKQKRKNFVVLPTNLTLDNIAQKFERWDISLGMHDSI